MDAYLNDNGIGYQDKIQQVEIYFSNFEEKPDISLEEAYRISASYLPFDILDKYYVFEESYILTDKENGTKRYIINYALKDQFRNSDKGLGGQICTTISCNKNDEPEAITIGLFDSTPSKFTDAYKVEKLDINLYDYRQP